MKSFVSFLTLLFIKGFSLLFFRFKVGWPKERIDWNDVRLIVLLNHTSLLEPLWLGFLPVRFLRRLSKRMVAPGADKTLNRPVVGFLYKIFSPGMTPITRKRDGSWKQFMESIYDDSIIVIVPEGRMKRKNGLDLNGEKMTVRAGIADVLQGVNNGQMILAYSGGLHHVHVPGEKSYHLFKTLRINMDVYEVNSYKESFGETPGSSAWRKKVVDDLQWRLENKCPPQE